MRVAPIGPQGMHRVEEEFQLFSDFSRNLMNAFEVKVNDGRRVINSDNVYFHFVIFAIFMLPRSLARSVASSLCSPREPASTSRDARKRAKFENVETSKINWVILETDRNERRREVQRSAMHTR